MIQRQSSGWVEIPHTADWALKVWAPDLRGLLEEAAIGMQELMEIQLDENSRQPRQVDLADSDEVSLLVRFLAEILYLGESEGMGFEAINVKLDGIDLHAVLQAAPIRTQRKEIKAVTYHKLAIQKTEAGLETVIVFDV